MADANSTTDSEELSPGIAAAIILPILVGCFLLLLVAGRVRLWLQEKKEARTLMAAVNAPRPVQRETKEYYNYDWTLQTFEDEEKRERHERQDILYCFTCTCTCPWRSPKVYPMVVDEEQVT